MQAYVRTLYRPLGVTECEEAEQVGLSLAGFIKGVGDGAGGGNPCTVI